MKKMMILTVLCLLMVFVTESFAQLSVDGAFHSWVYTYEKPDKTQEGDFYEGIHLKFRHANISNSYLNTYFRVAKRGDNDWEAKAYNLYASWKSSNKMLDFRLGRQFIYNGVITGTLDGLLFSINPMEKLNFKLFGGFDAPYSRKFRVASDSTTFGLYASYNVMPGSKIEASYFQKDRNDSTAWQLAGLSFNGKYNDDLYYILQYDHNLKTDQYQSLRARATYYISDFSFTGEYANQRPRIYEDSFFRRFALKAYQQMRGGVTYQLGIYQLGAEYVLTNYKTDHTNQGIITVGNNWGIIGLVFQDGFAGKNTGLYGDIRYDLLNNLTVKLFSSYYKYDRHAIEIDEEATAFSGGVDYKPFNSISLQAEVQESINSYYDNDWRGLFRFSYYLNYKSE